MKRALLSHTFIDVQWAWFVPVSTQENSLNSPASHPRSTFAARQPVPLATCACLRHIDVTEGVISSSG